MSLSSYFVRNPLAPSAPSYLLKINASPTVPETRPKLAVRDGFLRNQPRFRWRSSTLRPRLDTRAGNSKWIRG